MSLVMPNITITNHEHHLKGKIHALHTQLLDFNRQISPSKIHPHRIDFPVQETKFWLTFLGCLAWISWPLSFPAFVYYNEGSTPFFWQVAAVSTIIGMAIFAKFYHEVRKGLRQMMMETVSNFKSPNVTLVLIATLLVGSLILCTRYNIMLICQHKFCISLLGIGFLFGLLFPHMTKKLPTSSSPQSSVAELPCRYNLPDLLLPTMKTKRTISQSSPKSPMKLEI